MRLLYIKTCSYVQYFGVAEYLQQLAAYGGKQ